MQISFNVLGLQELQKLLKAIENLSKDPRVDKALGRGASMMQGQIKLLTPVDLGLLRNSIIINRIKMMEWAVETNCEYAIFVEFGTGKLGDKSVPHTSKESWVYYSDALHHFVVTHGQTPAAMFRDGFEMTHNHVTFYVKREVEEIIINAGRA